MWRTFQLCGADSDKRGSGVRFYRKRHITPDATEELKHDGFRAVAYFADGECRLVSRRTHQYKSFASSACGDCRGVASHGRHSRWRSFPQQFGWVVESQGIRRQRWAGNLADTARQPSGGLFHP
jgi:hypothetical protein